MNISTSQAQAPGHVPVAVIKLDGQLDGQNYQDLITEAQELYNAGARSFLLDLAGLTYISSAGLVALYSVVALARGEALPETKSGRPSTRAMGPAGETGTQKNVKLLNPRAEVLHVLDVVGFGTLFQVFTNLDEAVNSF
ncbi:MAG: STAS domain-containing protein [Anaerolineales bacterium]